MISKVTKNDFNESTGNRSLQAELERKHRIKTYFYENDKTPNTDGYFEILDRQGISMQRFVVQIKTVRKLTRLKNGEFSYPADTAFLQYILENIDRNPAIFFIIDLSTGGLYYKYLSLEYLLSLSVGRKKKVSLRLSESDMVFEDRFYDFCMDLIRKITVEDTRAFTQNLLPGLNELYHTLDELSANRYTNISAEETLRYPMILDETDSALLRIPQRILEKYENIRLIGSGGTSKVFSLTSKITGSKAALKIVPKYKSSAKFLLNEYRFLDRLRHPSLPRVLDYYSDDETEYMVMDYIEGYDLQVLASQGMFSLAEIIAIISDLCGVVHFLYKNGIIHRDIKPSNIMVGSSRAITLLDFDSAVPVDENSTHYPFMGTVRYSAPETFSSDYVFKVSSSIFSIGATLYYSLINAETSSFLQLEGSSFKICEYIANYGGDELGYGLVILKKALAQNPAERYKDALELQEDLMIWQKKEYIHASALNLALAGSKEACREQFKRASFYQY